MLSVIRAEAIRQLGSILGRVPLPATLLRPPEHRAIPVASYPAPECKFHGNGSNRHVETTKPR